MRGLAPQRFELLTATQSLLPVPAKREARSSTKGNSP